MIKQLLSGGLFKSVENIATEWIETDKESAEAQAIMVKTLDPNGLMRRDISNRVLSLYQLYVYIMCFLLALEFFNFVPNGTSLEQMAGATAKLVDLFVPVTSMVGIIVGASFGVNYANVKKDR
jgi:hypothetical protein|tara:strand:- start:1263 stop:1631 length:369 start_codon:yes stop_codon:yes gene_type:complete